MEELGCWKVVWVLEVKRERELWGEELDRGEEHVFLVPSSIIGRRRRADER